MFALILPILLHLLVSIEFGRLYLGYVNLQSMARIGANNAAAHASEWGDSTVLARYQLQIAQNALLSSCALDSPTTAPVFSGTDVGDSVA